MIPRDIRMLILTFLVDDKHKNLIQQIPYENSKWFWGRGYIKSPCGNLHPYNGLGNCSSAFKELITRETHNY